MKRDFDWSDTDAVEAANWKARAEKAGAELDRLWEENEKLQAELREALFQKQGYYDQVGELQAELAELREHVKYLEADQENLRIDNTLLREALEKIKRLEAVLASEIAKDALKEKIVYDTEEYTKEGE
jgi:regulator of replication initiation timing